MTNLNRVTSNLIETLHVVTDVLLEWRSQRFCDPAQAEKKDAGSTGQATKISPIFSACALVTCEGNS